MTKLIKIDQYWINPANIAFLSGYHHRHNEMHTIINFNAYSAAANETQSAFEPLSVDVALSPDDVAALINPYEPVF